MKNLIFLAVLLVGSWSLAMEALDNKEVADENGFQGSGSSGTPTTYTPTAYTPTLGANGEPMPPPQPSYEFCGNYSGNAKYACDARNKAKIDQYAKDVNTYNAAKAKWVEAEKERRKKQTQEEFFNEEKDKAQKYADDMIRYQQESKLYEQDMNSSKKKIEEAIQKSEEGKKKYEIAKQVCSAASMAFAAAFAASCIGFGATCNYYFLATSIAAGIGAGLAGAQANKHAKVSYDACQLAGRVSSTGTGNCAPNPPPPYNPTSWPLDGGGGGGGMAGGEGGGTEGPGGDVAGGGTGGTGNCVNGVGLDGLPCKEGTEKKDGPGEVTVDYPFGPDGKCKLDPAACEVIKTSLPPGVSIKDVNKKYAEFASGKGLFKMNKDGSITDKKGKTFKASDFASEAAMVAAGFSPADAKAAFGTMGKLGMNSMDATNASALAATPTMPGFGTGLTSGSGSGSGNKNGEFDSNGSAKLTALSGSGGGDGRAPASAEGLAKDYNGELIGVAGDDIFKMMNRRYNLKAAQDSFIGP